MEINILNQRLGSYLRIIALNAILLFVLRIFETSLIILNFGVPKSLFQSEILGFIFDLVATNTILLIIFPLYFLVFGISEKIANRLFAIFISTMAVIHYFILKYFLYQLIPLDIFLYKYSFKEIFFTISTADLSYVKSFLLLAVLLAIIYFLNEYLDKIHFRKLKMNFIYLLFSLSVLGCLVFYFSGFGLNYFSRNKSLFFYSRSFSYFMKNEDGKAESSNQGLVDFQRLNPGNQYLGKEYPLLHEFKNLNVLKPYFKKFDTAPNIVVLIVEGLSDDFIHDYRGVNLMPFTSKLKDKSLYWDRCFTLGERSFAVIPSLLGSLPYGEKGFTLLDKLPKHLSLVSILNANDYHTTYFYGQAAWFHQNDRFFKYNNVDLIYDNSKFPEKYHKIIVGNDNFFWGYNDKDLFNQSFEVIDTIRKKPRLDIYFTGTSHSPFAISDPDLYNTRFAQISSELKNDSNVVFFDKYKKYIQSILFADDALESFFKKYETRPDYDNTIFIITGDHPMTEIPIANSLKRYHVPLMIYSKQLNSLKTFSHTVSHLDLYETLLSFLSDYKIKVPELSAALGSNLIIERSESEKRIAFMNDNREIIDYYSNNYFLSGEKLFSVGKGLALTASTDVNVLRKMQDELKTFKNTNNDVCLNDKIIPDSLYYKFLGYHKMQMLPIDSAAKEFNAEYYNLVNSTALKNKPICYNVSFESFENADKDLCLVFQLSNGKDSLIYWQSANVTNNSKLFQVEMKIPAHKISDSMVYFKSYFWNKSNKKFRFRNFKYSLYQK